MCMPHLFQRLLFLIFSYLTFKEQPAVQASKRTGEAYCDRLLLENNRYIIYLYNILFSTKVKVKHTLEKALILLIIRMFHRHYHIYIHTSNTYLVLH